MISDQTYLTWQKRLTEQKSFRIIFDFFGMYALLTYGFIALYFLFLPNGYKKVFIIAIAGLVTHYVMCKLVHKLYPKPHPYQRLNFRPPSSILFSLLDEVRDSFPSEHSSTTAAVSAVIFCFSYPLGVLAFSVAVLTALARVVLGYHDIEDIFGGLILGTISGYICYFLLISLLFTH